MTDLDALIRERENGDWWKTRRTIDATTAKPWRLPRQPRDPKRTAA